MAAREALGNLAAGVPGTVVFVASLARRAHLGFSVASRTFLSRPNPNGSPSTRTHPSTMAGRSKKKGTAARSIPPPFSAVPTHLLIRRLQAPPGPPKTMSPAPAP